MDANEEIENIASKIYNYYVNLGWKNVSLECCERQAINYINVRGIIK
tara:strand:+ start:406 stop:546 length:141 start_codon:yes stop_codon:yes gene_type:complete